MMSNSDDVRKVISKIKSLKKRMNLHITDVHVHPLDVMGVVPGGCASCCYTIDLNEKTFFKPGTQELFKFGKLLSLVSPLYYTLFPESVHKIISKMYTNTNKERLLREMDLVGIDSSILLPVAPWAKTSDVIKQFKDNRFLYFYSPDIHNKSKEELKQEIEAYKQNRVIVGIKLHPNLQGFKPQPSHNNLEIADKLRCIYETSSHCELPVLFHVGKSFYTEKIHKVYEDVKILRSHSYGELDNYIDSYGSEVFDMLSKVPVILAHLGSFGVTHPELSVMKNLIKKYNNIYFDTSGSSDELIYNVLRTLSSRKILFGTDAIYNKMSYALYFLYKATRRLEKENPDEAFANVVSYNILRILKS